MYSVTYIFTSYNTKMTFPGSAKIDQLTENLSNIRLPSSINPNTVHVELSNQTLASYMPGINIFIFIGLKIYFK